MSRLLAQEFRSPVVDPDGRLTREWQQKFKDARVLEASRPNSINDPRIILPVYANNAAAVAGGLVANQLYRTGGDPDLVCVVH